jgi:hypothetical protein
MQYKNKNGGNLSILLDSSFELYSPSWTPHLFDSSSFGPPLFLIASVASCLRNMNSLNLFAVFGHSTGVLTISFQFYDCHDWLITIPFASANHHRNR